MTTTPASAVLATETGRELVTSSGRRIMVSGNPAPAAAEAPVLGTEGGAILVNESGQALTVTGSAFGVAVSQWMSNFAHLPELLAEGLSISIGYQTHIEEVRQGEFGRVMPTQQPQLYGQLAFDTGDQADYRRLVSFFHARFGGLYSFRARDPFDWTTAPDGCSLPNSSDYTHRHALGAGDNVQTTFQLRKRYFVPARNGEDIAVQRWRPITRPIQPGMPDPVLHVFVDGVLQATNTYTVNYDGGTIQFATAPGRGSLIEWAGTFHVPLRFAEDVDTSFPADLEGDETIELTPINVVEDIEGPCISDHKWRGSYRSISVLAGDAHCLQLSDGFVQSISVADVGTDVYAPNPIELGNGGPHLIVENSGSQAWTLRTANDTRDVVVTAVAPGDWFYLTLQGNTWEAHR